MEFLKEWVANLKGKFLEIDFEELDSFQNECEIKFLLDFTVRVHLSV